MAALSDDGTKQWDPTGGPGGTGAWVPVGNPEATQLNFRAEPGVAPTPIPPPQAPTPTRVAGAWGGTGDSIGPDGKPIAGTNGMAVDRDRYRDMGASPLHPTGPQIDRSASDQSRGITMGALGMLRDRAGGGMTPAQQMAAQQTQGAVAGIQSGAASIKGGAMARAAAARGAQATGARVQAQGNQDAAALRAREMADGANQYFGGASAQRGQDLGLATDQAKLEAGQQAANDQREGFYEGIAQDTQKSNLDHQLGRNEADVAATAGQNANNAARDQQNREAAKGFANMTVGGLQGVASGMRDPNASSAPAHKSSDPWDPTNYKSDPKTKKAVKPINDAEAKRLKAKGDGMIASNKAKANAQLGKPEEYDGKYLGSPFPEAKQEAPQRKAPVLADRLDEMFGTYGDDRGDPYAKPAPEKGVTGAPKGYAASRDGGMGSMFGTTMRPEYDIGSGYSDNPGKHYASAPVPEREMTPDQRDIALSDPAAKRDAYLEGMQQAHELRNTGKAAPMPDYVTAGNGKSAVTGSSPPKAVAAATPDDGRFGKERVQPAAKERRAASGSVARGDRAAQNAENKASQDYYDRVDVGSLAAVPLGFGGTLGAWHEGLTEDNRNYARGAHARVPPSGAEMTDALPPEYARASLTTSDPKTKQDVQHFGGPMADANRSMEPSSYEYKPEFLPPEQKPGEKNVGPMADKMEADPVAGTAIVKDPNTGLLAIDKTKGLKLVMGGLASLQRQVDKMGGARR